MTTIWSGGWILIRNKISDKTPPGFHPRWNMRANTCILMRPFIDKDYSWKQCSTRENRSVHNFLLFHWRRHVKKLGYVLHQVLNACWWSKKPEFLTYDVKHSLLLRLFLNFELLHFESWNSWFIDFFLLVPRHRLRTKETIQPNNKPFTLSCWCYLRVYLVPRKTEKSFPLRLVCWDATRKKQTGRFVTRSAQIINFSQGYRNP